MESKETRTILWYSWFGLFVLALILGSIFQGEVAKWMSIATGGTLLFLWFISTYYARKENREIYNKEKGI